jgi:citrate lyase subunit beta/citryl-CoA lyase
MLGEAERRNGLPVGSTRIVPLLETAPAIHDAAGVFGSSRRVAYGGGIVAPSGDVALAIGFRWSDTFEETFVLRSQVLIAARACGIENPITGLVTSVDPEPVRRFALQSRALGYAGMFVIHPSHVPIANEAFRPSPEELAWSAEILADAETAEREGRGTFVDSQGRMIDAAMLRVARSLLERDRAFSGREPRPG